MASGRNNARRRRVILDEAVQSSSAEPIISSPRDRSSSEPGKAYSPAAKRRGQLKTTDLMPKRPWSLVLAIGSVVFLFALLNVLAFFSLQWTMLSAEATRVFSLSGVGTVSNWFSSLLLLVTGMASLQIYGMRKHRCDDYNGHYRIWLLMAVLFVIASANCVVDFRSVASSLTRNFGLSHDNSVVVLLVAKLVALTALVARGVLEIRASRGALAAVIIVWIAYASAIVTQIPSIESQLVQNNDVVFGNLFLIGTIAAFLSILFFARHVYLHANDLIEIQTANATPAKKQRKGLQKGEAVGSDQPDTNITATKTKPDTLRKKQTKQNEGSEARGLTTDGKQSDATPDPILRMPLGKKLAKANKKRKKKQQRKAA